MGFDQDAVTLLENAYPEFKNTEFLQELLALVPEVGKSVFFDDFLGKAIDTTHFWTVAGGTTSIDYYPGGTGGVSAAPGGQVKVSANTITTAQLHSPDGIVDNAKAPKAVFRIKTGTDLTNVVILVGMPEVGFANAAYWQYTASRGTGAWEACTGADDTVVDSVRIDPDTWYVLSVEEQKNWVDFGIAPDPDATITDPPVIHRIRTNVPAGGTTDRRLEVVVQPTEVAEKYMLVDWVKFTTNR